MSKITILDKQEPSVQSADRTKNSVSLKLRKCVAIHEALESAHSTTSASIITYLKINSGFHARGNPSEEAMSESSQGSYMER